MCKSLLVAAAVLGLVCTSAASPARADDAPKQGFLGVALNTEKEGVVIGNVLKDSPADKAGLKAGDEIVKVNDTEVKDVDTLLKTVKGFKPGDKVTIKIKRDGKEQEVKATLGEAPKDE